MEEILESKIKDSDKLDAALKFIRRCGASQIEIRYSNEREPIIWLAVATFKDGAIEVDAAKSVERAVLRLCERLADGGKCTHCNRPVGFEPDSLLTMPLDKVICWYQYDPELKTIRRGCE